MQCWLPGCFTKPTHPPRSSRAQDIRAAFSRAPPYKTGVGAPLGQPSKGLVAWTECLMHYPQLPWRGTRRQDQLCRRRLRNTCLVIQTLRQFELRIGSAKQARHVGACWMEDPSCWWAAAKPCCAWQETSTRQSWCSTRAQPPAISVNSTLDCA